MMVALYGSRLILGCLVLSRLVLQILLESGEVLLSGGEVAGLQVLRKLVEGLGDGIVAFRRRSRTALGHELLQTSEIRLRGRQIAGLQILAQLLEQLLKIVLRALRIVETNAGNTRH